MIALTHFPDGVGRLRRSAPGRRWPRSPAGPVTCAAASARSTDDPDAWVLLTEWANVGSYRRALGNYEVKLHATPLLAAALDLPGGFETLLDVAPGGAVAESAQRPRAGSA